MSEENFDFALDSWTITPEEGERIARDLQRQYIEDHIRQFGGVTLLCLRPKKDETNDGL
jgi:hypothetical protein